MKHRFWMTFALVIVIGGCRVDSDSIAHLARALGAEAGPSATREIRGTLPLNGGDQLTMDLHGTTVGVVAAKGQEPHYRAMVAANASTPDRSNKLVDTARFVFKRQPSGVIIEFVSRSFGGVSAWVKSFRGVVPPQAKLQLRSRGGDVRVGGPVGGCTLASNGGDIVIDGVLHDRVHATSRGGDVSITAEPGSTMTADWTIRSQGGDALVIVPQSFSCRLVATAQRATYARWA